MPRNIEIKARLRDMDRLAARVAALVGCGAQEIMQVDTFFRCAAGRLKVRCFEDGSGELIFYQRENLAGPKQSCYIRSPTSDPAVLCQVLAQAYGELGKVVKRRRLFISGRTRIHLDSVERLGQFLELEVVLSQDESEQQGIAKAHELMRQLGIVREQLVEGAYIDMLREQ